jgi:hypothetical protein
MDEAGEMVSHGAWPPMSTSGEILSALRMPHSPHWPDSCERTAFAS